MREIVHLTQEQIVHIVQQIPFFSAFHATEQMLFAKDETRLFSYHNGEFLIQEGGDDHALFFLLVGAASVVKEGAAIPLAMLGPGDMFGEVGFLMQRTRTTNVIVHPPALASDDERPVGPMEPLQPLFHTLLTQSDPPATTIALQFRRTILHTLPWETRITLKNQIIQRLMLRVERMNARLTQLTGHTPQLSIDEALESRLHQEQTPSPELLEATKERIIAQLVAFVEELNRQMVAAPPAPQP